VNNETDIKTRSNFQFSKKPGVNLGEPKCYSSDPISVGYKGQDDFNGRKTGS